jgi:hypothetical protein
LRARRPLVGFPADPWGYRSETGNAAHVVRTMAEGGGDTSARFAVAWLDARVMPGKGMPRREGLGRVGGPGVVGVGDLRQWSAVFGVFRKHPGKSNG